MSTKVSEKCPKCQEDIMPIDKPIVTEYNGRDVVWRPWRYECDDCDWTWTNLEQRNHNAEAFRRSRKQGLWDQ